MRLFGRMESETRHFLQIFREQKTLPEPNALRMAMGNSPLVSVYQAGYAELQAQLSSGGAQGEGRMRHPSAVAVEMQVAASEEIRKLEQRMPWLATTGSVTPFIGLFGTVWGVMDAFTGLGDAGAATLRAVAPGIAEALVTTAAGLFTAVPAVIAYNHFLHKIRDYGSRMDSFTMEFASMIETMYTQ
jgi:biopolymer transport protein TolQ